MTIQQSDALDFLRSMEANSADVVLTDPPYCSGGFQATKQAGAKKQGVRAGSANEANWFASDNMSTAGLVWLLRSVACEAHRILKPGGSLLMFCDWRQQLNLVAPLESSGLQYRALVVWDKGSAAMGLGFRPRHELILHFSKGKPHVEWKGGANVVTHKRVPSKRREHPTEKPVPLLVDLLRVTCPDGGLVVDPFAGSGTTWEAARALGLQFKGCEREPRFVDVAVRRADPPPSASA